MSEHSGLGPLELAVLEAVEESAPDVGDHAPTHRVIARLETHHDLGSTYTLQVMRDLGVPWRTLAHPLDLQGNWGWGETYRMADPTYTEVGLSEVGRLVLAAERGGIGPVPLGLVNGTFYRGGRVPPLDPGPTLDLIADLSVGASRPVRALEKAGLVALLRLPTNGLLLDGVEDLVAGRPARVVCSVRIRREATVAGSALVVTGTAMGYDAEQVHERLHQQVHGARQRLGRPRSPAPPDGIPDLAAGPAGVAGVSDESSDRVGTRVVVTLTDDADPDVVESWLRSLWPLTVVVDWQMPGGLRRTLDTWADRCRADPSGLVALRAAIT